jgi:hypothetical protein
MATSETTQPLQEEITSAVSAVWNRHSTKRPTNGSTEIRGNVVKCRLPNAVADFERGPEGADAIDPTVRRQAYRRAATAAVAKSMHCRVVALISERDAETDTAVETFVLDAAPKQASFGDPGWIAR